MKPIIILPPGAMKDENIQMLRDNELCVVVADNPAAVKFVDSIPSAADRGVMEKAAIALSRKILSPTYFKDGSYTVSRATFAQLYVDILAKGTTLDAEQSQMESDYFNSEKMNEISRLAREEAKVERAAMKEAAKKGKAAKAKK